MDLPKLMQMPEDLSEAVRHVLPWIEAGLFEGSWIVSSRATGAPNDVITVVFPPTYPTYRCPHKGGTGSRILCRAIRPTHKTTRQVALGF